MAEANGIRSRIQEWLDEHPERGYKLSNKADALIIAMAKRKKTQGHSRYYCPCMVVKNEDDPMNNEYNDSIECKPCLHVRDELLALEGIENEGTCHCGMIIKDVTNQ